MAAGSAGETGEPASSIARRAKLEPICATGTSAPIARIPMRAAIAWTVLARCQAATAKKIENHGVNCCQARRRLDDAPGSPGRRQHAQTGRTNPRDWISKHNGKE